MADGTVSASIRQTRAERLASLQEKAHSVQELAKRFEQGLLYDDDDQDGVSDKLQGRNMISKLLEHAKELRGRVVGRNADDCDEILEGLGDLLLQWDRREAKIEHTMVEANKALWDFRQIASSLQKAEDDEQEQALKSARRTITTKEAPDRTAALKAEKEAAKEEAAQLREKLASAQVAKATAVDRLMELQEQEVQVHDEGDDENKKMAEELKKEQVYRKELEGRVSALTMTVEELRREGAQLREQAALKPAVQSALMPAHSGAPAGGYQVLGRPVLGGTLRVADANGDPPAGGLQWSRADGDGIFRPIAGACRTQYSPDPSDAGCTLSCSIGKGADKVVAATKDPVMLLPGLEKQVDNHVATSGANFNIVIVQLNGEVQSRKGVFQLCVNGKGVEILSSSGKVKFKAQYSTSMQVCGARGGGDAASHGVYLCLQPNLALMLACENSFDRNVCIMLIRQFAAKQGILLGGPKDDMTHLKSNLSLAAV